MANPYLALLNQIIGGDTPKRRGVPYAPEYQEIPPPPPPLPGVGTVLRPNNETASPSEITRAQKALVKSATKTKTRRKSKKRMKPEDRFHFQRRLRQAALKDRILRRRGERGGLGEELFSALDETQDSIDKAKNYVNYKDPGFLASVLQGFGPSESSIRSPTTLNKIGDAITAGIGYDKSQAQALRDLIKQRAGYGQAIDRTIYDHVIKPQLTESTLMSKDKLARERDVIRSYIEGMKEAGRNQRAKEAARLKKELAGAKGEFSSPERALDKVFTELSQIHRNHKAASEHDPRGPDFLLKPFQSLVGKSDWLFGNTIKDTPVTRYSKLRYNIGQRLARLVETGRLSDQDVAISARLVPFYTDKGVNYKKRLRNLADTIISGYFNSDVGQHLTIKQRNQVRERAKMFISELSDSDDSGERGKSSGSYGSSGEFK